MEPYIHTVQYYETDKMGVAHHSNYIRWMEEARVAFLAALGWPFEALEARGLVSPVVALDCKYRLTTRFAEAVSIYVRVQSCSGVRLCFAYEMRSADGALVFEGRSEHCFLNTAGRPVRLNRELPDFFAALTAAAGE